MTVPAQFNFMDGGERALGNWTYYGQVGITNSSGAIMSAAASPVYIKPFFFCPTAGDFILSWNPSNAFSSASVYSALRIFILAFAGIKKINFVNSAGTAQISLQLNSNGSFSLFSGATLLGTSNANLFFAGSVFQIDMNAIISATVGAFSMRLNGNPTPLAGLNLSGINTAASPSNLPVTNMQYGIDQMGIRDMYIHDGTGAAPFNTFLGNGGCEYLPPIANVTAQFTPNGNAQNYQNAAETPPNPTVDFNSAGTVGLTDTFTITPLPSNVQSVIGLKVFDYSYKNDTGSRALQKSLISGAITATGAENFLNETATVTEDIHTADPNTSAAFTPAGVNALNIGITVAA